MCDTVVAKAADGTWWLAKNSDREPGEAQLVEHLPRTRRGGRVRCTHLEIDDVDETLEVAISRPFWMWGAEMGVNERGVAIGNEAVFTKLPLARVGLTGMDLLRLALERAPSARAAVDVIAALLKRHGQGGRMGYRNTGFAYASSFLIVDATEAWVLETAGNVWAAARAPAVRSISNALTLGAEAELVDDDAVRVARTRGWCTAREDFDFARCFSHRVLSRLAGATVRANCTSASAARAEGNLSLAALAATLRDHGGRAPSQGLVMTMPCAHAAPWPTRTAGQSTASMVAQLGARARVWVTGTSSPCLSVFKPVPLASGRLLRASPAPGGRPDDESLWWRHERLHRAVLAAWDERAPIVQARAAELERALGDHDEDAWERHRAALPQWTREASAVGRERRSLAHRWYWRRMDRLEREAKPAKDAP
ncbi:MAG: C69 family dipeptidase [Deltaproteobacteria bacterium]|nr:C69 family dipeptidase [Deltaproteobacteria bacterium]